MSPTAQLLAFAQSVYLNIKNRYYDSLSVTDADSQVFLNEVVDFINQYLDELETETDDSGEPVRWPWLRTNGYSFGTIIAGETQIDVPSDMNDLVAEADRYMILTGTDGSILSQWTVVTPGELDNTLGVTSPSITPVASGTTIGDQHEDKCAVVGSIIMFNRPFTAQEDGGTLTGDVLGAHPRVTTSIVGGALVVTNISALSLVKPKQLIVLGVAKNLVLSDIVKGVLTPSFNAKYADLLAKAIARAQASALSPTIDRDNFSYISGVGF